MTHLRWLACAAALSAMPTRGVTIDFVTVGDPGNAPAVATGWGSVPSVFRIATVETTNTHYVEFLNAVDAVGINPNGVYSAMMGSDANGGIIFDPAAATERKYAVKPGSNPNGAAYAQLPVAFTTWFSAARFVNWLGNGQQRSAASMENGAYLLANRTSGTIPARNAGSGAQVVLPSRDEWYKAAFYSAATGGYVAPSGTNTITQVTVPGAANFGGAQTPTFGTLPVGSYVNTRSPYGLADVLGNVIEYTDTAGTIDFDTGRPQVFSGSWATATTDLSGFVTPPGIFRSTASGEIGFRVAEVTAVPEPAAVAAAGIGGLAWWLRPGRPSRRRVRAAGGP